MWGVQKTHNLIKEYTYRVRTLIWPFYFNLDHCELCTIRIRYIKIPSAPEKIKIIPTYIHTY